jgi:putative membrane protein
VLPDPYAWSPHVEATAAVVLLAAAYALALRSHPAPRWRVACFAGGCGLLLATAVTPLDPLSFHLLFAHLLQNVVLAEWAPALLVLGLPAGLVERLSRSSALRTLTRPLVALPLWLAVYFAWHVPIAYDTALEHPATLLHLEHASYVAAGVLVWWPALRDEPWRLPDGARAAYVFGAFVLASPLGLLLALLPEPIYDYYQQGGSLWGLSPRSDQQLAGVTMAVEQAVVLFVAFAIFFARFMAAEERGEGPVPPPDRAPLAPREHANTAQALGPEPRR